MAEPFVKDGLEFALITVKGQSFMLHQIRKMVGMTICVTRGHASAATMDKAWQEERVHIPRAPGLGLMLDEVHYESYNRRFGKDGIHQTLDWTEGEVAESVDKFKKEVLFEDIVKTELEEKSMMSWLDTLICHDFSSRHFEEDTRKERSPMEEAYAKLQEVKRAKNDEENGSDVKRTKLDDEGVDSKFEGDDDAGDEKEGKWRDVIWFIFRFNQIALFELHKVCTLCTFGYESYDS